MKYPFRFVAEPIPGLMVEPWQEEVVASMVDFINHRLDHGYIVSPIDLDREFGFDDDH